MTRQYKYIRFSSSSLALQYQLVFKLQFHVLVLNLDHSHDIMFSLGPLKKMSDQTESEMMLST